MSFLSASRASTVLGEEDIAGDEKGLSTVVVVVKGEGLEVVWVQPSQIEHVRTEGDRLDQGSNSNSQPGFGGRRCPKPA